MNIKITKTKTEIKIKIQYLTKQFSIKCIEIKNNKYDKSIYTITKTITKY